MKHFHYPQSNAIVTGATSGIGRSLVDELIAAGSHVVATGRRIERLDQLSSVHGDRVRTFAGDVTDAADRERLIQMAGQLGGKENAGIDLLINNAGIGAIGRFDEASSERLRTIFEVDFFAAVELTRLALPRMTPGACVCNIGSVLGHRAVPNKSEYSAAKFALHGWSDALRTELLPRGISVTLVSPSTTQSEFFDSLVDTDPTTKSKSIGIWSTDRVARAVLRSIRRRRRETILSWGGKALVYADRLFPDLVDRVLMKSV